MLPVNKLFIFICVILLCVDEGFFKDIPEYIQVCKRDQNTINECVKNSVEKLRPKLAEGLPELDVPGIEPFSIPEINVVTTDLMPVRASGKDVKVSGAGNFIIKSISVDLDTFTIRARARFPKLHFEGRYKLDAQILVVPFHGQGNLIADGVKCDAEIVIHSEVFVRDGVEYLKFTDMSTDIGIKDFNITIDGLFNGDKALGTAANEAINQNRGEFLKATKPYLEKTVSKILLNSANKIVDGIPLDSVLPKP